MKSAPIRPGLFGYFATKELAMDEIGVDGPAFLSCGRGIRAGSNRLQCDNRDCAAILPEVHDPFIAGEEGRPLSGLA